MYTATIGLRIGNRVLCSSYFYSDTTKKLSCRSDIGLTFVFIKNLITTKRSSNYNPSPKSNRDKQALNAIKNHAATGANVSSCTDQCARIIDHFESEGSKYELSVEALLLLQKSLLEKQWNISTERNVTTEKNSKKMHVTGSQISARRRRINAGEKLKNSLSVNKDVSVELLEYTMDTNLLQNQFKGHVKGGRNEVLLTHSEVNALSRKIKVGLLLEEQKSRLKKKLGYDPSEEQLATSMRISRTELRTRQIECTLARQKLTLSNVRLVMSIAQKYDNMGAQMADLIQGGLIGLLRGIEKYDSSRGFKISTYVYWWIRQGVSRALMENSKVLRLPTHLHERQSAIRNAKIKLEEQGINPSVDRIAESLNMSRKKVINAKQAITKVFSLDRGQPGQTLDNDIADNCMENDPWHGVGEKALKDEVNKLITVSLGQREQTIIRLYYGIGNECLTWEDIGKRIGLSREGVRQIGLVALEKLKHAARNTRLEALLVKY
ncbi:RNA polymerase sigma factor sigA-like isoform X2 [Bidens hawaiensis]|uniref:RNA polymerase sigma factor sigA-like isoform X2 n=1 Tax=Bidens hawaiensis TaxID=980011 RepID=UPI00404B1AA2